MMKKATSRPDSYEFRLGNELKSLAETELRETCATRDFALKALRDWIESNPRIAAARLGKHIENMDFSVKQTISFILQFKYRFQFFATIFASEKV